MISKKPILWLFALASMLFVAFTCNRTSIVDYFPSLEAYSVKHVAFPGDGVLFTSPWYSDGVVFTSKEAAEIWELLKDASMDNSGNVIAGDGAFLFEQADKIHRRTATQFLMNRFIEMPDDFVLGQFSEDSSFLCLLHIPLNIDAYLTFKYRQYKQYVAGEAGILVRRAGHCDPDKSLRLYDRFARLRSNE